MGVVNGREGVVARAAHVPRVLPEFSVAIGVGLFPFTSLQIDNLRPRLEFLCVVADSETDSRCPLMPKCFVHGKSLDNVEAGFCWMLLIDCRGHIKVRRSLIVLWFGTLLVGCLVHAIPVECLLPDLSIKVNVHGQPIQDRTLG